MPRLSKEKKDKISEQILHYLFAISPDSKFSAEIADEIARDEEFTKSLLLELHRKALVVEIKKNKNGIDYVRRQRWRLSSQAFDIYKKHQTQQTNQISSQNLSNLGEHSQP
jgi:predicted transcriptional regulator with HTH domain